MKAIRINARRARIELAGVAPIHEKKTYRQFNTLMVIPPDALFYVQTKAEGSNPLRCYEACVRMEYMANTETNLVTVYYGTEKECTAWLDLIDKKLFLDGSNSYMVTAFGSETDWE